MRRGGINQIVMALPVADLYIAHPTLAPFLTVPWQLVGTVYVPLSASEVPPAAHIFRCGFRSGKGPNCLASPQAFICKATPSQVPQVPPIQIPPSLSQNAHQGSERPHELLPLLLLSADCRTE